MNKEHLWSQIEIDIVIHFNSVSYCFHCYLSSLFLFFIVIDFYCYCFSLLLFFIVIVILCYCAYFHCSCFQCSCLNMILPSGFCVWHTTAALQIIPSRNRINWPEPPLVSNQLNSHLGSRLEKSDFDSVFSQMVSEYFLNFWVFVQNFCFKIYWWKANTNKHKI